MRSGLIMGEGVLRSTVPFLNFIFKENQGKLLTILAKLQS